MPESARPTVTTKEAAEILGVSRTTITRLIKRGDLDAYKLIPATNSPLRIYRDSIDALLKAREAQPTQKQQKEPPTSPGRCPESVLLWTPLEP